MSNFSVDVFKDISASVQKFNKDFSHMSDDFDSFTTLVLSQSFDVAKHGETEYESIPMPINDEIANTVVSNLKNLGFEIIFYKDSLGYCRFKMHWDESNS